ncbi:uncharacterized protein BDV17DRAFT_291206 [Aspergillus undulatus]|uniref:uncharacterized protein n=1 Tax=Aspergillus undulatus TaxID=1810928 RepID=UPI003CCD0A50
MSGIAWRGAVPESVVSEGAETSKVFGANRPHATASIDQLYRYTIPGTSSSLGPGTRNLDFAWYANIPASFLRTVMTVRPVGNISMAMLGDPIAPVFEVLA